MKISTSDMHAHLSTHTFLGGVLMGIRRWLLVLGEEVGAHPRPRTTGACIPGSTLFCTACFREHLGILHTALLHAEVGYGVVMPRALANTKAYLPYPPGVVIEGPGWSSQPLRPHPLQPLPLQQVW